MKVDCKARSRKPSVYSKLDEQSSSEESESAEEETEPNIAESLVNLHSHRQKKAANANSGERVKHLLPSKSQTKKFDTSTPGRYDASQQESVLSARSETGR